MRMHVDIMIDGHPWEARWITSVNPEFWELKVDPPVDFSKGLYLTAGPCRSRSWVAWLRRLMRRRFHPRPDFVPLQQQLRARKRRRNHK